MTDHLFDNPQLALTRMVDDLAEPRNPVNGSTMAAISAQADVAEMMASAARLEQLKDRDSVLAAILGFSDGTINESEKHTLVAFAQGVRDPGNRIDAIRTAVGAPR